MVVSMVTRQRFFSFHVRENTSDRRKKQQSLSFLCFGRGAFWISHFRTPVSGTAMAKSESKMSTPGDSVESPNADEPAASTASVAASVATTTTTAKPTAEEPPSVFSNAAYACDRQYAIVLAQLMNTKDREKTYTWIRRLGSALFGHISRQAT